MIDLMQSIAILLLALTQGVLVGTIYLVWQWVRQHERRWEK